MPEGPENLLRMRDAVLAEMAAADVELSRLRMLVERMESDLRIGRAEDAEYQHLKGHAMPQAENEVLGAYRNLLKIEDRINARRGR